MSATITHQLQLKTNRRSLKATIAVGVLVVVLAILAAAVGTTDASAAHRWSDGAYVRSVAACKNNVQGQVDFGFYANTRGIVARIHTYVSYVEPLSYERWNAPGPWFDISQGYSYSWGTPQLNPTGFYFWIDYGRRASNGTIVNIAGEFVPVFQYSDGSINMKAILDSPRLPSRTFCQLGMTPLLTGRG